MKKKHTLILIYGFIMWSVGWASVRMFDQMKIKNVNLIQPEISFDMLQFINEERTKAGVGEVIINKSLIKAAEAKACEMNQKDYFSHQDPSGRWGWHFLEENNVFYDKAGENLAKDVFEPNAKTDMDAFMNSPSHREIILDPEYEMVGYASCGVYTVQYFIKP